MLKRLAAVALALFVGLWGCAWAEGTQGDFSAELTGEGSLTLDLDGDGSVESVRMEWKDWPEMDGQRMVVRVGEAAFETEVLSNGSLLACSLDPQAGTLDLLAAGDVMSDDYVTVRLQYKDGALTQVGEAVEGRAARCAGGRVTIGDWVDLLGTRWCERPYALDGQGTLVPVADELWIAQDAGAPEEWYTALTTKAALPVTMITESGEEAGELAAGTRLAVTATDGATRVYFALEDGARGYIELTPATAGWGSEIAGKNESEYFEMLPYAG